MARPKPEMTEAQKRTEAERLAAMQQAVPENEGTLAADAKAQAASLHLMRGLGENVECNERFWMVSPFILRDRTEGYQAVRGCHALLVSEALAAPQGAQAPLGLVTEVYNRITGRLDSQGNAPDPEAPPFSVVAVTEFLSNLPAQITDEEVDALYQPILINLRRHHPEVTRADLEDDFDLSTFVRFLRAIQRQNTGLIDSF